MPAYSPGPTSGAPSADAALVDTELASIALTLQSIQTILTDLGLSA